MGWPLQTIARQAEIARLDATSRTRVLSDAESQRLEQLIRADRYATHRRLCAARKERAA